MPCPPPPLHVPSLLPYPLPSKGLLTGDNHLVNNSDNSLWLLVCILLSNTIWSIHQSLVELFHSLTLHLVQPGSHPYPMRVFIMYPTTKFVSVDAS